MTDENDPEFQRMLTAMQGGGYPDAVASSETADFQPTYSPGALPTVDSIKQGLLSQQLQMPGTYDPAPTQPSDQPPPQVPGPGDALKNLALQSIQGRLQAGMQPPDTEGLQRAQTLGNIGGLVSGLGSSISGMVGTPYGGAMNPAAYLGALATHRQQNFDQGTFNTQNAQNQPVQQYMQRQAQRQLGLAESQKASDEAIRYGNMLRAEANEQSLAAHRTALEQAKNKTTSFTPEQIETTRKLINSTHQALVGEDAPPEMLEAATPANAKDIVGVIRAKAAADAKLKQIDAQLRSKNISASQREALQNARLQVAQERLGLSKTKFGVELAQAQIPGVELDQPIAKKTASELTERKYRTVEAQRAIADIADRAKKAGLSGAFGTTEAYGDLKARFGALIPKLIASEYGRQFTEGHRHNVESMLDSPNNFKTAVLSGRFQAEMSAIQDEIGQSVKTAIGGVGGHLRGGNLGNTTPGTTRGIQPYQGIPAASQVTGGGAAPVTFIIKGTPTPISDPADIAKARAANLQEVPGG